MNDIVIFRQIFLEEFMANYIQSLKYMYDCYLSESDISMLNGTEKPKFFFKIVFIKY